jgi:MscS family membrane protein
MLRVAADAAASAALAPARVILPAAALASTLRTAALALQILIQHELMQPPKWASVRVGITRAAAGLAGLDAAFLDAARVAVVVFACWFAVGWKDALVAALLRRAESDGDTGSAVVLERVLVPFAGLATWALIAAAALTALAVVGVDPAPLLTVGGVGGLAVGFGAQSVTSNAISGLNLYVTRPFVVGERVTLQTQAGGAVATGVVERIDPMRTVVRSDKGMPLAIPNRCGGGGGRGGAGRGGCARSAPPRLRPPHPPPFAAPSPSTSCSTSRALRAPPCSPTSPARAKQPRASSCA